MIGMCMPMRGGVTVGRVVAATDVPACHAQSQVHPLATDAKAVFAPGARGADVDNAIQVRAGIGHAGSYRGSTVNCTPPITGLRSPAAVPSASPQPVLPSCRVS